MTGFSSFFSRTCSTCAQQMACMRASPGAANTQDCTCDAACLSWNTTMHICNPMRCRPTKDAVVSPLTLGACRELPASLAVHNEQTMRQSTGHVGTSDAMLGGRLDDALIAWAPNFACDCMAHVAHEHDHTCKLEAAKLGGAG